MTHGGHELALQVYRFRVRMLAPRNSFLNNIRDSSVSDFGEIFG